MYLYHATGKENIESIMKEGLIVNPPRHAYGSEIGDSALRGKVYLAFSADTAEAYAEVSEAFEEVVVLKINLDDLDQAKIRYDWNNRCEYTEDINSCAYEGNISPKALQICDVDKEPEQDIYDFEDTELFERIIRTFDEECETNKEYGYDSPYGEEY